MADESAKVSIYQQVEQEALDPESVFHFHFHCHAGLNCFNRCCRTPTILLSPYDLLRLKQALGCTTGEILARYTIKGTEEVSNLPLIFVDAYRSPGGGCPFLSPEGCTVYAHRPAACRLFPITMGSQLTGQGIVDYYFCRRLDYCRGFAAGREWTVASWQADQGFAEFDQGRREWLEILLKTGIQGPVATGMHDLAATIAYDLDQFREMVSSPGFSSPALNDQTREELKKDDFALLKFSYHHLKALLLPEEA